MTLTWIQIMMVPPRYGKHDQIEMFGIDSVGQLWHRFSSTTDGGWTRWELDPGSVTTL